MRSIYDNHDEAARLTPPRPVDSGCYQEQPGLEVDARVDTNGLHKDFYAEDTNKHTAPEEHIPDERQHAPGAQSAVFPVESRETAEPGKKQNRRRLWVIVSIITAAILIIGGVLGGVLGSRVANASHLENTSAGTDEGNPGSRNNSTPPPPFKNIRPGSRLAVTGWRESPGYHIRLFYQGPDQHLRFSNYSTTEADWYPPVLLDQMDVAPRDNTFLAASTSLDDENHGVFKVFYVDNSSKLAMQRFPKRLRAMGVGGRLNSDSQEVAPNTRLGAYWPHLLSQRVDASGKLIWTTRRSDQQLENTFFNHTDPGVDASPTSGLAIVPASSKDKDAAGFIYRRRDGKMMNNMPDRSNNFNGTAWAKGDIAKDLNGLTIPAESPLAAFTVAGLGTNADKLVSTYVLYIGPNGEVNMVWLEDNASGWKGPRTYPEAFGGADAGTDIACLTPAAWGNANMTLLGAYDMSRCYFQAEGGRVRQVQFDGSEWKSLGYLPID